jgi:hypothetical protein
VSTQDRLYIEKDKSNFIRKLIEKGNRYLLFNENKESFLYAMVLGMNNPTELKGAKDGLVRESYLKIEDMALLYSIVLEELNDLDELTEKNKVYGIAEKMANTGYKIMNNKIDLISYDNLTMKLFSELDELYENHKKAGII